jgi:hypothetical protein
MHGHPNIKFAISKTAKETPAYKNIKGKMHRTTAAMWFNKDTIDSVRQFDLLKMGVNTSETC